MNDFWNTSDGKEIESNGSFVSGSGLDPFPDGTEVLSIISEAELDEYEGQRKIKITWIIGRPEKYKNRKIFQSLYVFSEHKNSSIEKADRAKRMLAAIDKNAGGKLMDTGNAPTTEAMTKCLVNSSMQLKIGLFEAEDGKAINYVTAVAPKGSSGKTSNTVSSKTEKPAEPAFEDDDNFPF